MKRLLVFCMVWILLTGCTEKDRIETESAVPETIPAMGSDMQETSVETEPLITMPDGPDVMGFTSSNILQGGYLAGDGEGWIYYRQENLPGEEPSLWKARENGSDAVKLTDDAPESINVLDGWVYYLLSDSGHIVRVRTDGSDRQVLLTENCALLHAAGSGLYFQLRTASGERVDMAHMTLDGSACTILLENTELQAYYDHTLYAWKDSNLLRYTPETGESREIHTYFAYHGGCLADAGGFYYYGTETWSFDRFLYYSSPLDGFYKCTDFPFITLYQGKPLGISVTDTGRSTLVQAAGPLKSRLAKTGTETLVLAELSGKTYDTAGNWAEVSDSTDLYQEQMGVPYLAGDTIYLYGTRLRESLAEHGQFSCIAQVRDGSVVFWHCVKKARYTSIPVHRASSFASDAHLMELFPDEIRIIQVSALSHHQRTVLCRIRRFVDCCNGIKGLAYPVNGENIVLRPCGHHQLPGCNQAGKIAHLEILPDRRDMVAHAVGHGGDGGFIGTYGTAGSGGGDPFIHTGQIIGGCSSAGIAGADDVFLLHFREGVQYRIQNPHGVPDPLTDGGSAHEEGDFGGFRTAGTVSMHTGFPKLRASITRAHLPSRIARRPMALWGHSSSTFLSSSFFAFPAATCIPPPCPLRQMVRGALSAQAGINSQQGTM